MSSIVYCKEAFILKIPLFPLFQRGIIEHTHIPKVLPTLFHDEPLK
jgi:hypothetical protein